MMKGQSQIYLPTLTLINKILISISGGMFLLNFICTKFLETNSLVKYLGLSAHSFYSGHFYKIMTYPFLSNSLMEVILNCLMIWLMGSEFEENWGIKRYLGFISTTIIGGALCYLLVVTLFFQGTNPVFSFPLLGLSGIVGALCLAYAVIYPDRIFSFLMIIPIKAKYFCFILVLISLYQGLDGPMGIGAWGHLGALFFAYLFMLFISRRHFLSLSEKINKMTQRNSVKKSKANLTLVKDDKKNPPKYWQ